MKLWTIKEVIEMTGFSERTVARAIKTGKLESRKIGGSRRIHHDWLVAWLGFDPLKTTLSTSDKEAS
jgi:excisionase family DNA binding protein